MTRIGQHVNSEPRWLPEWRAWIDENIKADMGTLCIECWALDESLTLWEGTFYVPDPVNPDRVKVTCGTTDTYKRTFRTTPARAEWLIDLDRVSA